MSFANWLGGRKRRIVRMGAVRIKADTKLTPLLSVKKRRIVVMPPVKITCETTLTPTLSVKQRIFVVMEKVSMALTTLVGGELSVTHAPRYVTMEPTSMGVSMKAKAEITKSG